MSDRPILAVPRILGTFQGRPNLYTSVHDYDAYEKRDICTLILRMFVSSGTAIILQTGQFFRESDNWKYDEKRDARAE